MIRNSDVLKSIEKLAPANYKMSWDNVGLLCGRTDAEVSKILVALDPFPEVCREAASIGANLLVTHHPLIFRPCKAVSDANPVGETVLFLVENGISAINAHTNFDVAIGGVNDCLAETLGLRNVYSLFDKEIPGFLRFGTVEETGIDVFAKRIKELLHCSGIRYINACGIVHKVAIGGGACADELEAAAAEGCDTFVTADIKYNQFEDAKEMGINIIDAGHFETEFPAVYKLASYLKSEFPDIPVEISKENRNPVRYL